MIKILPALTIILVFTEFHCQSQKDEDAKPQTAVEQKKHEWSQDYAAMAAKAKAENKYLLMNFAGTKWCGWCIRLNDEVFTKQAFLDYADESLVLLLLDYPRNGQYPEAVKEQNPMLAQKYGVRGFPTIILLSPDGEKVAQTGYQPGGPEKYVAHLKQLIADYEAKQAG